MDCTFLELRCKEVIKVVDGKRLGHIVDIVIDLFGGSGLLAHTIKRERPELKVIYNDYDNYY